MRGKGKGREGEEEDKRKTERDREENRKKETKKTSHSYCPPACFFPLTGRYEHPSLQEIFLNNCSIPLNNFTIIYLPNFSFLKFIPAQR